MLKDDAKLPQLVVGSAAGRAIHERAVLLGKHRTQDLADKADSFCVGVRQFGRPMMALHAKRELGPVRHALSQMVVAGTMVTQPPMTIRVGLHHPTPEADGETSPPGGEGEVGA